MRHLQLVWALPLLAQAACAGNRYAVSGEVASRRNDNKWRVVQEPPAPPPVVVAPPVAADSAVLAAAPPAADAPAPSEAAFPLQDTATAPPEAASAAPAGAEAAVAPAPAEQPAAAPPPPPPPPPEEPMAHERVDLSRESESAVAEPERQRLKRMVWGLSLRIGGTFGSEDLLEASYTDGSSETLTTGGGANIFLGTTVIPFKFGGHSLGFGFEGGWKFSSIGQGSDTDVTLSRNAIMPRIQYGYELSPAIHWIAAIGAQYETGIKLKATGGFVGVTKFDNALGGFGESGILLDIGLFAVDLTLRHTRIDYAIAEGPSISANSWGIFCALHVGLLKAENESAYNASR